MTTTIGVREFLYSDDMADACVFLLKNRDFKDTYNPDGTMVKLTDPSKLHALGWKHTVELEEGIRRVYEW